MVYTNLNRIQFGNGDVSVMVSMAGTRKEPQAMLVFQNREPTKIGRIDEDADLSRTKLGAYNPNKDIAMLFSKPESIRSNSARTCTLGSPENRSPSAKRKSAPAKRLLT